MVYITTAGLDSNIDGLVYDGGAYSYNTRSQPERVYIRDARNCEMGLVNTRTSIESAAISYWDMGFPKVWISLDSVLAWLHNGFL